MESDKQPKTPISEQSKGSDYQQPELRDYGSLLELTEAATLPNGDVPHGVGNAFS